MNFNKRGKWYFVTKIVLTYCEKNCFSDREKLFKSEADGREFAKIMRSLEQFVQTMKSQKSIFKWYFVTKIVLTYWEKKMF